MKLSPKQNYFVKLENKKKEKQQEVIKCKYTNLFENIYGNGDYVRDYSIFANSIRIIRNEQKIKQLSKSERKKTNTMNINIILPKITHLTEQRKEVPPMKTIRQMSPLNRPVPIGVYSQLSNKKTKVNKKSNNFITPLYIR